MGELIAGRYELVRELGRGGMGEVLLARQVNLGRLVVIKRVIPEQSMRLVRALLDEARLAARLHHPCIVSVLDVSADDVEAFVAMEYVAGVTLRDMLHRAPEGLPLEVALEIGLDVLRGLSYAHGVRSGDNVGIVHRDIKPRNVMVTFSGDTKIIDFGISRWLAGDGAWESTSVSGTHGYMAPEQQMGRRVDSRADQYAVSVTLREMITGASPRENAVTLDERRPHDTPAPTIDPALAEILARAAALEPENRYNDCAAFAAALENYAETRGLSPSTMDVGRWMSEHLKDRIHLWERDAERASNESISPLSPATTIRTAKPLVENTAATVASGERVSPPPRRPRPNRPAWRVAVAAVAVLGVLGGGAAYLVRARPTPPSAPLLVGLTTKNLGDPGDAWLGLAVEHMTRRALRDVDGRRFWLTTPTDSRATLRVELSYRNTAGSIHLEARRVNELELLGQADATSLYEAVERLSGTLATAIGGSRDPVGPDDDEAAEMARIGASSFSLFRRYRVVHDELRVPGWIDATAYIARLEKLVAEDPGWAHPYADLFWLRGDGTTPAATKTLADARAHVDRARDPVGVKILDAFAANADARAAEAAQLIAPVFQANNADMLAGEVMYSALINLHRTDEARAVLRRLHELHPEMYFAGDLAQGLEQEGRDEQAEQVVAAALAAVPDNLTAARERVRLEAQRGDLAGARRDAQRMLLIHGERPIALGELYDAMIISGELVTVQRIVDRMLLGSPLMRARGRYRDGVLAVFEGRLGAAVLSLRQAIDEFAPFGDQSELPQCYSLMRGLVTVTGGDDTAAVFSEKLATWFDQTTDRLAAAGHRYRAALGGNACPVIEDYVATLDEVDRGDARRTMLRAGVAKGCAKCKDAVAAGFAEAELSTESLVELGRCAVELNDIVLARRAFEQAARLWSSWSSSEASPFHAILATYYLGNVLVLQGDLEGARRNYERFLQAWGRADRGVPEVALAQRALKALGN